MSMLTEARQGEGFETNLTEGWGQEHREGALFHGDMGELPLETRRTLVQLLLGPNMDARCHGRLWSVLLRNERMIRSRLHELLLDLVLDRDTQVAYTRQRQDEAGSFPVLLRKAPLNFLESTLVIYLRQLLLQGATADERVVVSQQELHDHLAVFERTGNQDRTGFESKVCAAVDKLHKLGLLRRLGRGGERFEVSPTLKLLFSAEDVERLGRTLRILAQQPPPPDDWTHLASLPPLPSGRRACSRWRTWRPDWPCPTCREPWRS